MIVLGPTGVGKSAAAIRIAKIFGGEIINCDSMQVYKGFDIGTDKIPLEKREGIPHHLLDIVSPAAQFTAAEFAAKSLEAMESIQARKKLPILVGGTGLYIKALLDGLFPEEKKDPSLRKRLENEASQIGLNEMWRRLETVDPAYARKIGKNDRIRIIRALEVYAATKKPISEHFLRTRSFVSDFNVIKIGLKLERKVLYKRIEQRVDNMFARGIVCEVEALLKKGIKEDSPPFRALGYKHVLKFLRNEISLEEAIASTKMDTRHYAKRQVTWFKKMPGIQWFSPDGIDKIETCLHSQLT